MPEPPPFFSVVIPTYNRAVKVTRAIESVLSQTWPDFDVWVVDDGSTDATGAALAPYRARIHTLRQENSGVAAARNHAMLASRGTWIAFLDSDDRWKPTKLAAFAEEIRAHPTAALFYSSIAVVSEEGHFLRVNHSRTVRGSAYLPLLKGNFLSVAAVVVRRDCLSEAGLFDTSLGFAEDWDLWLRIARRYPIQRVPGVLTVFETARSGKKSSDRQGWLQAHDQILAKAFQDDPGLSPSLRREIQANIAVVKGRIFLEAGDTAQALGWFEQAAGLSPRLWKAQLFRLLSAYPSVLAWLPGPFLRRLHLSPPPR